MVIRKGRHTAAATVKASDAILADANAFKPYYALGFKLNKADADSLVMEKSFEIIVVKCENKFFGNWYHGGTTVVKNDAPGEVVSSEEYVSSPDGSREYKPIDGKPSVFNDAKLLQDRKMTLNYSYSNGDGTTTYVNDYLQFRNRIRDGVNEWQSENPEDYK